MSGQKVLHCYKEEGRMVVHTVHGDRTETFRFEPTDTAVYWYKLFELEKEGYKTYEEE